MHSDLAGFAGVAALVTIAPGADFALVSRRAIGDGVRTAVISASGVCSGVLMWGALSALGISALLAASAYNLLRLAGGAYLVLLGVQALLRVRRLAAGQRQPDGSESGPEAPAALRQGLVTNLLNPKVGVFYSAVLPQFVSHHDPVLLISLLFALLHAVMGMAWYFSVALALSRGRRMLARPCARAALETITAIVLIGFGARRERVPIAPEATQAAYLRLLGGVGLGRREA